MPYSSGIQNYIGVKPPELTTTTNQIGSFSEVEVTKSLNPTTTGIVDIGRSSKRFRSAYIQELDGVTKISDMDIVSNFETGTRITSTINQEGTAILVEALSTPFTGTIGSVAVDTFRSVIVAVGTKNGNTFAAYSSPYPGDTWTLSTSTSSITQTIRFLDYSPTLDVFVGFDHRNISTNQYVYCTASDLNAWQFLTLPTSFLIRGSTWLPTEGVFLVWGNGSNIWYSYDGLNWSQIRFPITGADIKDICVKNEVEPNTGADRFIYSVTGSGYYSSTSLISTISFLSNTISNNVDVLCWNPYTRQFLATKNATSEFNVAREDLTALVTGSVSSGGNKSSRSYLPPALWVPEVRCHFLSRLTINTSEIVNGTMLWNGGKDTTTDLTPFPNSVCASGAGVSMPNTAYVMGRVAYLPSKMTFFAPFYSGQLTSSATGVTNNVGMMVYRWTLVNPPSYLQVPTNPPLYRNTPTLSNLTLFDKYDRLVSTSQGLSSVRDYITGGSGSENRPLKNAYFSQSIKTLSCGNGLTNPQNYARPALQIQTLHPRGNIIDNMVTSAQTDAIRKGMISATDITSKQWTNTAFATAVTNLQNEMNMKSIGFPLNMTFALNRDGRIFYNTSNSTTYSSTSQQAQVTGVTGTNLFGQDIAFSPTLNRYVYANETLWYADADTSTANLGAITGSYTACKQPPFIGGVTVNNLYAFVEWIPWFGDVGAFIAMRSAFISNSAPTNSNDHVIFSYDGINFQKFTVVSEFNNPAATSTTNKYITSYAHDPVLREFGIAQRADPAGSYNASLHMITRTDTNSNYRMTKVTSLAPPSTAGTHMKLAFSPKLRIWVAVLGVPGTTTAGLITSNNLFYSTPPNHNSSNTFGLQSTWTSVLTKHAAGDAAGYCNWVDVKWHETLQMFIAVNSNAARGGAGALDSTWWYSLDGISWSSVGRTPSLGHATGDFASLLEGFTQGIAIDPITDSVYSFNDLSAPNIRGYTFDMKNNTAVMHHNYQFGTAVCPSNNPGASAVVSWAFTFPKAFVTTPTHVIFSFINPAATSAYSYTSALTAKSTTGFTITAVGTGTAAATGAPTIMWQAWE